MTWLIGIGLFIAVLVILSKHVAGKRESPLPPVPVRYEQLKPLSDPEQVLYWRLVAALPECVVLSQVTFSRFMRPATEGAESKEIFEEFVAPIHRPAAAEISTARALLGSLADAYGGYFGKQRVIDGNAMRARGFPGREAAGSRQAGAGLAQYHIAQRLHSL